MAASNAAEREDEGDGLLSVGDLCRLFEESEDSSYESRKDAERDRDYVDGKQLTAEETAALAARGQPPVIDNRIKTKIDYLVGLEKQQRVKPKAFPRTPQHEDDADAATEALRYVSEAEDYEAKRSGVWRHMLVEGTGGIRVYVENDYNGEPCIKLQRIHWDRLFVDPHSAEADYSDAGYLGIVTWMDYDDALVMYPDGKDILDTTLSSAPSETYDDKPKFSMWADKKRKRVRICQIWIKRADQWHFAEFTKGGILKAGPSPYVDDKGESDCELIMQSAYVDRDNNRYGLVREMITLQDEINKRRSKSLHLLNTAQVLYEDGAVPDITEFHKQSVRPDGKMLVNPGALAEKRIEFRTRDDLATAHFQLLQEAKNAIDLKGPNATEMGDKAGAGGSSSASGKAIIASQQGGMIQIGDLMDNLRHLDKRVFRTVWARIRQFWTAEKWIRVTDDERNVKWLGINLQPQTMATLQHGQQQDPEAYKKSIAGASGPIAELDCDIIIDDAPDSLTPQLEQFQALVELKKFDAQGEVPFRAIVAAMPNLKDKQSFLKAMDEQAEKRQGQPDPETAKAMAQLQIKQKESEQSMALDAQKHQQTMQQSQQKAMLDAAIRIGEAEQNRIIRQDENAMHVETERMKVGAHVDGEREKREMAREMHRDKLSSEKEIVTEKRRDPSIEKMAEVLGGAITEMGKQIGDGMEKQAAAIVSMGENMNKPKTLVRDKSGNIVGSRPVENLRA